MGATGVGVWRRLALLGGLLITRCGRCTSSTGRRMRENTGGWPHQKPLMVTSRNSGSGMEKEAERPDMAPAAHGGAGRAGVVAAAAPHRGERLWRSQVAGQATNARSLHPGSNLTVDDGGAARPHRRHHRAKDVSADALDGAVRAAAAGKGLDGVGQAGAVGTHNHLISAAGGWRWQQQQQRWGVCWCMPAACGTRPVKRATQPSSCLGSLHHAAPHPRALSSAASSGRRTTLMVFTPRCLASCKLGGGDGIRLHGGEPAAGEEPPACALAEQGTRGQIRCSKRLPG